VLPVFASFDAGLKNFSYLNSYIFSFLVLGSVLGNPRFYGRSNRLMEGKRLSTSRDILGYRNLDRPFVEPLRYNVGDLSVVYSSFDFFGRLLIQSRMRYFRYSGKTAITHLLIKYRHNKRRAVSYAYRGNLLKANGTIHVIHLDSDWLQ
jgi:hypothetical protein